MSTTLVQQPRGGELAPSGEMSVVGIVDRKRKIVEVLDAVMKEGEHYGRIPGCGQKPALFKAGAEVLATTFGLAPRFRVTRIDMPGGHREYEICCEMRHIATDANLGEGLGSCSTMESKYRWRTGQRICPACGKAGTIIRGKAEYGGGWLCYARKDGCGAKWDAGAKAIEDQNVDRVENPDIADTWNTVLKMAKKRAQIDATLTAVGASDILVQDLEDLPPGSIASSEEAVEYDDQWQPAPAAQDRRSAQQSPGHRPAPPQSARPAEPPTRPQRAPADGAELGSGDPVWDELLGAIGSLANLNTAGWLPVDLCETWDVRLAEVTSVKALNTLFGPWLAEVAKRAQRSKNAAAAAQSMSKSFNARAAELRQLERGGPAR